MMCCYWFFLSKQNKKNKNNIKLNKVCIGDKINVIENKKKISTVTVGYPTKIKNYKVDK
jgi:hypothetical protein